jgi:hypothetical protein
MRVSFAESRLAALCNSEAALAERWGRPVARRVCRRLLDLSAASASTINLIPGALVNSRSNGETTITFSDEILIRGVISPRQTVTDHILITSLDVHGGDPDEND